MYLVHCFVFAVCATGVIGGKISEEKKCHTPTEKPPQKCGHNEVAVKCKTICPPQFCNISYVDYFCESDLPCEPGCDCIKDHLRDFDNICVLNDNCPGPPVVEPECGVNEELSDCKIVCPPQSCDILYTTYACAPPGPCEVGCNCKDGFLRDKDGVCTDNCSGVVEPECGLNEELSDCKIVCPPQSCDSLYTSYLCTQPGPCEVGCNCKDGFLRDKDGVCTDNCPPGIEAHDGSKKCGPNEKYSSCKILCPPQSCESTYTMYKCDKGPCEPGCDCVDNYLRDTNGTCIPSEQCPPATTDPIEPVCGPNEKPSKCKIVCPPQSCRSKFTKYSCIANPPCEAGCDCIKGYLRNDNGTCIPDAQCPPAGGDVTPKPTEKPCSSTTGNSHSSTKSESSSQSSGSTATSSSNSNSSSASSSSSSSTKKTKGPKKPCHEENPDCQPTCAEPNPPNCSNNKEGCEDGYILLEKGGKCVKIEECPNDQSCNGDPHARINACPWPCPSTCSSPNASTCGKKCVVGCQCESGYILSEDGGKCVLPEKCKCGNPCGVNGTFIDCAFRCPNQYCPEDDSLIKVACKPGRPCPSGCGCKPGYRRKSYDDEVCILASDCPPVDCTRPNEVWDCCSSECLDERCENVGVPQSECYSEECQPKCVCKKDFCRDSNDTCVPVKESGGDVTPKPTEKPCSGNDHSSSNSESSSQTSSSAATSSSNSNSSSSSSSAASSSSSTKKGPKKPCHEEEPDCQPTCAEPNPPNCSSNKEGCEDGHILLEKGGKCVKIEDCPKGCNGDSNAVARFCPAPCPSTCSEPNAFPCKRRCEPLGCECAFGYLKDENGKCITPEECPGGDPCRENEMFVACRGGCPTDYCPTSDSRAKVICETYPFSPCFSGCVCKLNHKRLSREDDRCIVSSECPPVECTRQNEEWNSCPSDCLGETCESANSEPVTCNTLVLNCDPRCVCKKDYFRNETDICIPAKDC